MLEDVSSNMLLILPKPNPFPLAKNERKKMQRCVRMAKGEPYADSGKKL